MKSLKNQNGLNLPNSNTGRQRNPSKLFPDKVLQQADEGPELTQRIREKKANRLFSTCEQMKRFS